MSVLNIITYPNKVLRKKSDEIKVISEEIVDLALDMIETMYNSNGIGLAAPQVNELKKIIIVDVDYIDGEGIKHVNLPKTLDDIINHKTCKAFINPFIQGASDEMQEYTEGCLSIPGFNEIVKRPKKVKVSATLLNGIKIEIDAGELLSTCIQHEIDHLSGILFIDRISSLKRNIMAKKSWKLKREIL